MVSFEIHFAILLGFITIAVTTVAERREIHKGLANELWEIFCESRNLCDDNDRNQINTKELRKITNGMARNWTFSLLMGIVILLDLAFIVAAGFAGPSSQNGVCLYFSYALDAGVFLLILVGAFSVANIMFNPHSTL